MKHRFSCSKGDDFLYNSSCGQYVLSSKLIEIINTPFMTYLANFVRKGNLVSQETAKIKIDREKKKLIFTIGDGNHAGDFDEIVIYTKDGIEIIKLYPRYEQYIRGCGVFEISLDIK